MKKQCGYCAYMDVTKLKEGKFWCEKKHMYQFASSEDAENCYSFCKRFLKDMYLGDDAIKTSEAWEKANSSSSSSSCFITTAVVNILGLADKCDDLEVLRGFRKNYLQRDKKYKDLLVKYDVIGPLLARRLSVDPDKESIAFDLYSGYISICASLIKKGLVDDAIELYKDMTEMLIKHYGGSYTIGDRAYDRYDQSSGGHGEFAFKTL